MVTCMSHMFRTVGSPESGTGCQVCLLFRMEHLPVETVVGTWRNRGRFLVDVILSTEQGPGRVTGLRQHVEWSKTSVHVWEDGGNEGGGQPKVWDYGL